MIIVTAATGNIGNVLVKELLQRKEKVRALGRDPKKLESLAKAGAETVITDLTDPSAVKKSFQGADAVFTLIPPNYAAPNVVAYYGAVGQAYADALKEVQVKYVVNLSSIGAHLSDKTGPIKGLHQVEEKLNRLSEANILHLRPPYFMENLFMNLGLIKEKGINGSPLKPDLSLPMIATQDIATFAADRLAKRDFKGHTVLELHGQRELTMAEATRALGEALGKPGLPYVQFPYDDALKAMVAMGLSQDVAGSFIEMYQAFNDGVVKPTQPRSAQSTTSTSIEAFAKTFAEAYRKS
jgi:uncharacterized protein YbjT (DUF2867 family)